MDKLQLLDQQNQLQNKIKELIKKGENEVRKLTDNENSELTNLKNDLQTTKDKLEEIRKSEEITSQTNKTIIITNKMEERFSLIKAIRYESERRAQDDATLAVLEAGKRSLTGTGLEVKGGIVLPMEYRADIVAASNPAVGTETFSVIEPLKANLVTVQAGAQFLTGLVGNISIPRYSGTTSDWESETGSAKDGAGIFDSVTMSPKRLTTYLAVSKQFLNQDSANANALLMKDIVDSISSKLESTVFGKHVHAATKPDGYFTGAPTYTSTGAITWAKVVALETAVDTGNALNGKLAYILHPSLRGLMKTTAKAANTAVYVMDANGQVNGYPAYATSNMSKELQVGADEYGILFGNWSDLLIGQWGALDITVDPYSLAGDGKIKLVINSYFDVVKRRDASFTVGSLK